MSPEEVAAIEMVIPEKFSLKVTASSEIASEAFKRVLAILHRYDGGECAGARLKFDIPAKGINLNTPVNDRAAIAILIKAITPVIQQLHKCC